MLPNGIQYTKYWMEKVIGKEMVDYIFDFANKFNSLNLTAREMSLLFPVALTAPGTNIFNLLLFSLNTKGINFPIFLQRRSLKG